MVLPRCSPLAITAMLRWCQHCYSRPRIGAKCPCKCLNRWCHPAAESQHVAVCGEPERPRRGGVKSALLAAGAAADCARDNGATPLHAAYRKGHAEVVSTLLAAGAAVDHAMAGGPTLLFAACHYCHAEVVSALLAAGAAVDHTMANGATPLCTSLAIPAMLRCYLRCWPRARR